MYSRFEETGNNRMANELILLLISPMITIHQTERFVKQKYMITALKLKDGSNTVAFASNS